MDRLLLAAAASLTALTLPAAPARAEHAVGAGIPNAKAPDFAGLPSAGFIGCRDSRHSRHDRRRSRAFVCDGFGGWAYADGTWALANNRSWEPESYNDWWHSRPDRAFPRWVQEQRGGPCDPDRMWWSGTGWHC